MNRTSLFLFASVVALAGCATSMDNRVWCTAAKDRALATVGVGDMKVGFDVNDKDRAAICADKSSPAAATAALAPASAASAPK